MINGGRIKRDWLIRVFATKDPGISRWRFLLRNRLLVIIPSDDPISLLPVYNRLRRRKH
jgi:hypothetical protein